MYHPRSRLRLPGLQLCAVWSPGPGASSAASGKIPGRAHVYRGYSSARSGSPDRRVKRRLRGNPRSRLRLPGLQFCAVWSPGQARQAPPPGEIPGRACAYRGYGSARSGSPDRRVKRRLRGNPRLRSRLPGLQLCAVWSPGQARQAPPPGKSPVALTLTGATALRGMVARTGASSAASGKMPGNKSHFLIDLIPTQPDIF